MHRSWKKVLLWRPPLPILFLFILAGPAWLRAAQPLPGPYPGPSGTPPDSPDLVLEKIASRQVAATGETFTYTITLRNQGPADSGPLRVDDFLPGGVDLELDGGSLPDGLSCSVVEARHIRCLMQMLGSMESIEFTIQVEVSGEAFGSKTNLVTVESPSEDPSLASNNQASVSVTLVPSTDLNRDGRIDGRDAADLVFEINDGDGEARGDVAGGSFSGTADFDVNGDGSINQDDIAELARWILFRIPGEETDTPLAAVAPQGSPETGSVLDFPRLTFADGRITGVAIVNPNPEAAPVTLTAYSNQGEELAVAERTIEAGQQLSELTFQLFGQLDASTTGWFQATSPSPDLVGFFLDLDGTLSELDGADLPERANEIIFNTVKVDDSYSTELNIVNPNPIAQSLTLELVGAEGGLITPQEIPAMGSLRLDVHDVFGIGSQAPAEVTPDSYIIAHAGAEILGYQIVRGGTRDFQALNARDSLEFLNKIFIPQMAVLGGFESELGIVNYSGNRVLVTVSAFQASGDLFQDEVTQNPVTLSLEAGQSISRDLGQLFGFQGNQTLQGWLEISSTSQGINGYFSYRIPATGAQAAISAVAQGTRVGIFSHLATVPGFFTGVAALNTAAYPADYRIVALSKTGEVFGSFTGILRPGERISQLITELIPNSAGQNGGLIFIRSSIPIFLTALFGTNDLSVLANIPPQVSPPGFSPDAGVPTSRVDPPTNVVAPGGMQSFSLPGVEGAVHWTVDGTEGGTDTSGKIDAQGTYTAPWVQPAKIPVTVIGEAEGISSSASVDVIEATSLLENLGEVQSVAFLSDLGMLYTAELRVLAAGSAQPEGASGSAIFASTPDSREEVGSFPGEIAQIIPFQARDGREYLILLDATAGSIIRFDPLQGSQRVISDGYQGLDSITFDPLTGDLLVADATQVAIIPRFSLEEDLTPLTPTAAAPEETRIRQAISTVSGIRGLAVDVCTGVIYLSQPAQGRILALDRSTLQIEEVVSGLDTPFRLTGLYREGVSCPEAFHLFIVERGKKRLDLYIPAEDRFKAPWVEAELASDMVLLPRMSRFRQQRSLVFSRRRQGRQVVSLVNVDSIYRSTPVNPPPNIQPQDRAARPGPDLVVAIRSSKKDRFVDVPVYFRPGPPDQVSGGSDDLFVLHFTLDYDERRLAFDDTDQDADGIPDSIRINLPDDYLVLAFHDPDLKNRELAFLIIDPEAPYRPLPEIPLMNILFRTRQNSGAALIAFHGPAPQVVDTEGNIEPFDQILNGGVRVKR